MADDGVTGEADDDGTGCPSDHAVLADLGIEATALLGHGGEACVYALDSDRIVRVTHSATDLDMLERRRRVLDQLAAGDIGVALPRVIEQRVVHGRGVTVERRLPGSQALRVLAEDGTDRRALVRDHLAVARRIAQLPCPADRFGPLVDAGRTAATFRAWSIVWLRRQLDRGGPAFAAVDPVAMTDALLAVLPAPDAPVVAHFDAFLGNMLADGDRITAVLDFGVWTTAAVPDLDPLLAITYLEPEITSTVVEADRDVAHAWAGEAGLRDAVGPARRWSAAYWAGVPDPALHQWCLRMLQ